ncbi:hypothetical protein E4T66_18290 [Sinimarinibacterium sp. CAU 1509]|uniref:hypothetical protein n=1 Tax=Sinimarinibacterium sp. CAU 1509 TaxID=2562283 RepID=UPI0010AC3F52|nr:hypothetical protein [Sinimarinibacterium sp. CAU 1509]TJY57356.1 hypothetical protein E4T66_18290 [Sinimarinibacterium sp. CAU 1509]
MQKIAALLFATALWPGLAAAETIATLPMNGPYGTAYAGPTVLDQRDAGYQMALEHAANAQRALQRALDEMAQSQSLYAFPGFQYSALARELTLARDAVAVMVTPEQRRLRYQTLTPDGMYMRVPGAVASPTK